MSAPTITPAQLRECADWLDADDKAPAPDSPLLQLEGSTILRAMASVLDEIDGLRKHADAMADAIQFGDLAILTVAKVAAESYRASFPKVIQ